MKFNRRVFSIFILIFEGMGVKLFPDLPGRILVFTFILLLINYKDVKKLDWRIWRKFFIIVLFYIAFNLLKGTEPFYPMIFGWLSAIFTMAPYFNGCDRFEEDLYQLTKFCVYYSLLHVVIQVFFKPFIMQTTIPMQPKTLFYLFYYNREEVFGGLNRIQGFCWEPSNWNLLLNMNLVMVLFKKKNIMNLLITVLAIISVMSTTGIVVMFAIVLLYFLFFTKEHKRRNFIIGTMVFIIFGSLTLDVLLTKLANASGAARYGDFITAVDVLSHSPILGADVDKIADNPIAIGARISAWDAEGSMEGYMEREGLVNSFAQLFIEFGLPIGLLHVFMMFKFNLIKNKSLRIMLVLAILMVIMGTPISRTGFFYLFILTPILYPHKKLYTKQA